MFALFTDSQNSQVIAAEMDMMSALQARKTFLEKQLVEKRELLNYLCLREAVSVYFSFSWNFLISLCPIKQAFDWLKDESLVELLS